MLGVNPPGQVAVAAVAAVDHLRRVNLARVGVNQAKALRHPAARRRQVIHGTLPTLYGNHPIQS